MFIIRYLVASAIVLGGILVWGLWAGYSAWTITGLSLLALFVVQAAIVIYVVVTASSARLRKPVPAPIEHLNTSPR